MTSINIKQEAEKIFTQIEEKNGVPLDESYKVFIEFGIRQGILLAGMSLVSFEEIE